MFVSHASQDAGVAKQVCQALEAAGQRCWLAPRDVRAGDFYAEAIVQAINAWRHLGVILSRSAVESQHVLREVERASAKRRPLLTRASILRRCRRAWSTFSARRTGSTPPTATYSASCPPWSLQRSVDQAATTAAASAPAATAARSARPFRARFAVGALFAALMLLIAYLGVERLLRSRSGLRLGLYRAGSGAQ